MESRENSTLVMRRGLHVGRDLPSQHPRIVDAELEAGEAES